jgi:hypothetical protein
VKAETSQQGLDKRPLGRVFRLESHSRLKPLFHPGKLLITPVALAALRENGVPVIRIMLRHIAGDWGTVSDNDRQQNDLSIAAGLRLLSIYRLPDDKRLLSSYAVPSGRKVWIVTEADRSTTTILLPDEY